MSEWTTSTVLGLDAETNIELSNVAASEALSKPKTYDNVDEAKLLIHLLFGECDPSYKVSFATLLRTSTGVDIKYFNCPVSDAVDVAARLAEVDNNTLNLGCYVRVTALNTFFNGTGRGKAKDTAGAQMLWADLDVYKTAYDKNFVTEQLVNGLTDVPIPTLIVDSGNGLQVYWALDVFITDLEELKTRGKGIAAALKKYGADNVYNPTQLLRLPGTSNRKDPLNVKQVRILQYLRGNVYKIEQFPNIDQLEISFVEAAELPETFLRDLEREAPEIYARVISEASAARAGAVLTPIGAVDRSANDMWVAVKLFHQNVIGNTRITSGVLQSLFANPDLFIHSKTAERGSEYALRTVLQAESYVGLVRRKDPQRFFSGRSFVPALLGEELLYENQIMSASAKMWIYRDGVFQDSAANFLKQQIVEKLGVKWQRSHAGNALEWLRASTQKDLGTDVLPFTNVLNGMLHITAEKVELLPHSPTYCSLSQLPTEFQQPEKLKDELAVVDEFVHEILDTPESIQQFFQFIGTTLLPDYRFKKALLLIGPPDCGKSTLLSLFTDVIGEINISSRTFQDLAGGNRFAKASLVGKLANVYADLPTLEARDIGPFKALTGNDIIDAEFKGVDAVSFRNYAKLIFSTNSFPRVRFADQAFFERWLVIPCFTRFVPDEKTKKQLQHFESATRVFIMDRKKLQRLQTPEIRSAFLWRAIEGLQQLLQTGKFLDNEQMDLIKGEFMAYADPVSGFMHACTTPDDQARVFKNDLYNAFLSWCNYYSVEKISVRAFNQRLAELRTVLGFYEARNSTITVDNTTRTGHVIIGRKVKEHITLASGTTVRLNSAVEFVS